jgi:hypothetical protein
MPIAFNAKTQRSKDATKAMIFRDWCKGMSGRGTGKTQGVEIIPLPKIPLPILRFCVFAPLR